jgi:hypothetical protein
MCAWSAVELRVARRTSASIAQTHRRGRHPARLSGCDPAAAGAESAGASSGTLVRGAVTVFVDETLRARQVEHTANHSGGAARLGQSTRTLSRPPDTHRCWSWDGAGTSAAMSRK